MTSQPPALERPPRHAAFFAITAVLIVLFMAASSAPSPLYVVYQQLWGFSPAALTLIFAIYVFGLLGALLFVGRLSDHLGRRPVLLAAIALEIVSMGVFLVAGDTVVLCVARLLQGIATGAAISVLGAALVDLAHPEARHRAGAINSIAPTGGLALGALGCGALVQYGPAPTQLVYAILLAALIAAMIAVLLMPETVVRRAGALTSLVPRVRIPAHLRPHIVPVLPVLVAGWALGGLYFSLGPSVAAGVFGLQNHLIGGIVIALLCGAAALSSFLLRPAPAERLVLPAALALAAGSVISLVGIGSGQVVFALIGTLVAGAGFGAASVAAFGTVARYARPDERGALMAVVFIISYLAFSVPALVAGIAANQAGLRPSTEVYLLVVLVLALTAVVLAAFSGRRRRPIAVTVGAHPQTTENKA